MLQAVNLVPESALFNSLVMQERQLDNSIRRRRLELQQAAHPYEHPVQKRLRVYVGSHKDRLEVKRLGSSNVDVQVTLEQDASPPMYKLHSGLAELLGVCVDHQMSVLSRTWAYIHKQQEQADPQVLHLDDKLSGLMGTEELPRTRLPEAVGKLLKPLEPLTFSHTIDVSGPSPGSVTCLDLDVVLPAKLADKVAPGVDALLEEKGLESIEQKLATQLAKLFEARRRRVFLLGFAEAPVAFINGVIASQARELRAARTGPKDVELERRTDVFLEKWVEEAAAKYLAKRNGHPGL
eukprot:gene5421-5654_t